MSLREIRAVLTVAVAMTATAFVGTVSPAIAHGTAAAVTPSARAVVACAPGPTPSSSKSRFNTTPAGRGPWHVPHDPCNSEPLVHWDNCAYWAEEKRPDIWRDAVMQPDGGYNHAGGGAWNIKIDAKKYGYQISHKPKRGDLAAWPPDAVMGTSKSGTQTMTHYASPGGHVAYVEKAHGKKVTISTTGIDTAGGYTVTLKFNRHKTYFIHRSRTS
jgi:surface antigen